MESFKFENLEIWKLACEYSDEIYDLTKTFPRNEWLSLSDQLNRSSSSIADNIAEGSGSMTVRDFSNFLQTSIKSTYESVSQLYRAYRRGYITEDQKNDFYIRSQNTLDCQSTDECESEYILPRNGSILLAHVNLKVNTEAFQASEVYGKAKLIVRKIVSFKKSINSRGKF